MSLPLGWAEAAAGECLSAEYGVALPAASRSGGSVPVYGSSGIVGWHDAALVSGPHLVIGRKGNAGACHVSLGPSWPIDTTYYLRIPDSLDARFIGLQLNSLAMRQLDSSTALPSLRRQDLERQRIRIAPLAEQWRIVATLEAQVSRLDAAADLVRRVRTRSSPLREAVINAAFSDRWPRVPLGEIAEVVGGVAKDSKRQQDPALVEVPYLRVANVQRGYLDLGTITEIRVPSETAARLELRAGDVLFNEGGDRDKLGRGWVWSGEIPGCIHQNHVFRARLGGGFDPRFVSWWGNSYGRGWFWQHGRQTTNLASISLSTLKAFPVPAPSVDEQRAVVAGIERHLSVLDHLNGAVAASTNRGHALRRSILASAFRGELVPQDPNDEPASVLLARIAAERAAAPKPERRRVTARG